MAFQKGNQFAKGNPSNKTSFKRGQIPWNKGKHIYLGGGFKKGNIPWDKGKRRPEMTKENNPRWKGGKTISSDGYILISKSNHPFSDNRGYVRRSHLAMEQMLGRYLFPEEVVHHKGIEYPLDSIENKQDDRIENLQLFANDAKHRKLCHSKKFN